MKKVIILLVAAFFAVAGASAQQSNAIGLRGSYSCLWIDGWSGEISYQHSFGVHQRLEADLALSTQTGNLTCLYQYKGKILPGFSWYAGLGVMGGYATNARLYDKDDLRYTTQLYAFLAAQVGLEYQFPTLPLQVSLDYRPHFDFSPNTPVMHPDFGLSVRWTF